METTVIKTFNDSFEANLALAKLKKWHICSFGA